MHDHQQCRELFARLSEYIDRELDDVTCRSIEAHMAQCPPCQACLSTLKRTVTLCKQMDREKVPQAFKQRLQEMMNQNL